MRATHAEGAPRNGAVDFAPSAGPPELDIAVEDAGVLEFAAAPTLRFALQITNRGTHSIRSVALTTQIRIAANQRAYAPDEQARLAELFGEAHRWGSTLHSLFWTQATLFVPAFTERTRVELPVACTYDLDVAAAKYFHGVIDGEVPLELLFSGTIFYATERGPLQTARIALDREAQCHLPVHVWKAMMAHYFPNTSWLRLRQDVFDRLLAYRTGCGLGTWDATIDALLRGAAPGPEL
jgi:hypothetical protein